MLSVYSKQGIALADPDEWMDLFKAGKFEATLFSEYFDSWKHRFNLFDEHFPFFQSFIEEEKDRLKKYNIDVCSDIPLPVSRNDPIEKINLCEATNILKRLCSGEELDSVPLISALLIEFAEYTRAFTGRGRLKRDLYVLREDVLALSVIGAYLSRSYKVGNEYGYIFLDMTYPNVKDINRLNTNARILARRIIGEGKGPVTTLKAFK